MSLIAKQTGWLSRSKALCTMPLVDLLDGGTGEELIRRKMHDDRQIWSAGALVRDQYHTLLVDVHHSFMKAGSKYITCNNYGVTPGVGFSESEVVRYSMLAGKLADKARAQFYSENAEKRDEIMICGSLPPLLESYRPDKILSFQEGSKWYSLIGGALIPYIDIFLAETLSTTEEAKQVISAVDKYRKPLMVSFTLNERGQLRSEEDVVSAITTVLEYSKNHLTLLQGFLFNCCSPEAISLALNQIRSSKNAVRMLSEHRIRLGAYANRLTPIASDWALAEVSTPQAFRADINIDTYRDFARIWIEMGATIIGGCCGIDPEYIAAIRGDLLNSEA
ncbi:hypothetical protein ABG067_004215 [Albugo candida]